MEKKETKWLEQSSKRQREAEELRERKGQRGRQGQIRCGPVWSLRQKGKEERAHTE